MTETATTLLTLRGVADTLAVHEQTARRMVLRGDLPAFLAGGRYRIRKEDLQAYIRRSMRGVRRQASNGARAMA